MVFLFIVGLILGAVTVIFALQNIVPITVTFLVWHIDGSLALILLLAVLMGVLIWSLLSIPEVFNNYRRIRELKKQKEDLEKALDVHKIRNVEMESRIIHAEEKKNVSAM